MCLWNISSITALSNGHDLTDIVSVEKASCIPASFKWDSYNKLLKQTHIIFTTHLIYSTEVTVSARPESRLICGNPEDH